METEDLNPGADETSLERELVVAIRRIIRAVDQHSRKLAQAYGLTGPQLLVLQELAEADVIATGALARRVHLAQGTVSEILDRLEEREMVVRRKSASDLRKTECVVSPAGRALIERKPSLLQDRLAAELAKMEPWEKNFLLSALQRVASMMHAEDLDAAPVLTSGPVEATVEKTKSFLGEDGEELAPPDAPPPPATPAAKKGETEGPRRRRGAPSRSRPQP